MNMKSLKSNLKGRIKKVKTTNFLVPLFEAVSNSVHAIQEVNSEVGTIKITIIRKPNQAVMGANEEIPISGFRISDSGIGFTDENMASFEEADSLYKESKGGKGVGRISWLKFFESASISSVYKENKSLKRREFSFTPEGIGNEKKVDVDDTTDFLTVINLENLHPEWTKYARKTIEDLGIELVEHFMSLLVTKSLPEVILIDGAAKQSLQDLYRKSIGSNQNTETIKINDQKFALIGFKNYTRKSKHTIFLCGNKRVASNYHLGKKDQFFSRSFVDENLMKYSYSLFVESDYLDKIVNDDRDGFRFPQEGSLSSHTKESISEKEILDASISVVKKHLSKEIEEKKKTNRDTVKNYVYRSAPQYRAVIEDNQEDISNIHDSAPEKIDIQLRKIQFEKEIETKKELDSLLKESEEKNRSDNSQWKEKAKRVIGKLSSDGKATLASYIVQRKLILDLLEKKLKVSGEGYAKEEVIHDLIFPMKSTSDEISYEDQNLWIIDERLSYHDYLASDKPLSSIPNESLKSQKKPDLIVFDKPIALKDRPDNEQLDSITIIEFKRPGESAKKGNKTPVSQILDYMDIIIEGKAKNRSGRPITAMKGCHFYGYAICEIDMALRKQLARLQMKQTPDNLGMFGFFPDQNAYIEVISYDKVLNDAFKRNRILLRNFNFLEVKRTLVDL